MGRLQKSCPLELWPYTTKLQLLVVVYAPLVCRCWFELFSQQLWIEFVLLLFLFVTKIRGIESARLGLCLRILWSAIEFSCNESVAMFSVVFTFCWCSPFSSGFLVLVLGLLVVSSVAFLTFALLSLQRFDLLLFCIFWRFWRYLRFLLSVLPVYLHPLCFRGFFQVECILW